MKAKRTYAAALAAALVFGSMSSYVAFASPATPATEVSDLAALKTAVAEKNAEIKLTAPITIAEDLDLNGAVITLDNTAGDFAADSKAITVTSGATVSNATLNGNGVNCYLLNTKGTEAVTLSNWTVRGGINGVNNGDPPTAVGASMIKVDGKTVLDNVDALSNGDNIVVKCDGGDGVTITGESKIEGKTALNVWVNTTLEGKSTVKSTKRIIVGKGGTLGNLTINDATFEGGVMLYDSDTTDDIKGSVIVTENAVLENFLANGYDTDTDVTLDIDEKASVKLAADVTDNAANYTELLNALKGNENVTKSDGTPILVSDAGAVETAYSVTVADTIANGVVVVDRKTAKDTTAVKVTVTPDAEYELDQLTIKDVDETAINPTDNKDGTYTFTMPAKNVTVSATFKAKEYEITKDEAKNGTFTVAGDKTVGATQTITASPSEGYEVDTVTVKDKDNKAVTVTDKKDGTYTFAMPSGGAKVTVTFKATKSDDNTKPGDTKPGATDGDNNGGNGNDNKDTGIALAVAPVVLAGACAVVLAKKKK